MKGCMYDGEVDSLGLAFKKVPSLEKEEKGIREKEFKMMLKQTFSNLGRAALYRSSSSRLISSSFGYNGMKSFYSTSTKKDIDQQEENSLFQYDKPVDFAFLSKQFGVSFDKDALKKAADGVESYDIDNMPKAAKQLETLMRTEEGRKYLNILVADIKTSFGMDSEEVMAKTLDRVNQEFTKRAGEPIERLVERCQGKDTSLLQGSDREIYSDYIDAHPYVRYSRQLRLVMDIVDLVDVYNNSDSSTFGKAMSERFQVDTEKTTGDDVDYLAQSEDYQEDDTVLARSTRHDQLQGEILSMIKNDTLMHYLDRLFENASTQLFPVTSSSLSEAESQRRLEVAQEARLRLAQDALDEEEASDRPFMLADNKARSDDEEMAVTSLIPELDLLQPPEKQQQAKDPRDFLKYYRLYPKKIRNWIDYSHTPLGFFTELGVWYNFPSWYAKMYPAVAPEQLITESSSSTNEVTLPEDLRGQYRFGVTKEEAEILHPKLKEFLTFKHATQGEINQHRKKLCVQKYGNDHADTGSSSVQKTHVARNNKDNLAKRRIMLLQSQRKSMIDYLKRTNVEEYFRITKDLKIKNTLNI
ncbi:hypothetical protein DFA_02268 [Cavenderia fasciculata]|uniref:Uncharacterized protein n=1 Tax=Cavenderia fasciculata TaxID=261658 RepID=F4PYZ6_CACFS|nr:uncharacterized protein DFA_02268 [Cavenderia fasciculata]EGG19025.1 hypothetical protein DFA_02268 [Cavenderia fasciculata]|eukprot:XP_004366658.1 hypothetical protein DFA_02268 [Cavenderia fasciculata]